MSSQPETRTLYNGDCPICDGKMGSYAAYSQARDLPIAFDDLNSGDLARWGVTEDAATRLLHVRHRGELHLGFDAMLVLWAQMPRYRRLARIGQLPGIYQICDRVYADIIARWIYARHRRRKAAGKIA